ncbi:hypothetical protein [Aquimarina longa]|uniref:HD domain-containing protein n=1 Tax=Aquimarina longa TaxID=1080221 RepID=UPI0007853267|nr:hypothetical protein [Aquimarina longa]
MLRDIFIPLAHNYCDDATHIESLWNAIENAHNTKARYYHNLAHLEHLYRCLLNVKNNIKDWDMILFALFYHDYVYNVLQQNNEEQSAKKAIEVLSSLSIDKNRITSCSDMILATKGHHISKNNDVNYFTDADLSILGSDWGQYTIYFANVRKEYKYYPNFMYNKGRVKVLHHFIQMPTIFKTDYFYRRYEQQAKKNLQQEMDTLTK